jgi:formylglycine-generating enzyme required for sulfatase activity
MMHKQIFSLIYKKGVISFLSLVFLLVLSNDSQAQCFDMFSKEGDAARAKGEIKLAIEKWERAKKCSDYKSNSGLDVKIKEAEKILNKPTPTRPTPPPRPNPNPNPSPQPAMENNIERDRKAWKEAQKADNVEGYYRYLDNFPMGIFRFSAKKRITELSPVNDNPPVMIVPNEVPVIELNMIAVKGGSFSMGNDNSRYDDEKPAHEVQLKDFYMSKHEVTIQQWKTIMKKLPDGLVTKDCEDCPIHNVSWTDIQVFIVELSNKTNKKYRLPTEAEWEYAAKGGNQSKKFTYSGGNDAKAIGWFSENSNAKPNSVGKKIPNELGLCDMTGNVREWCADFYDENYYKNANSNNPKGATTGSTRVFRGGDFNDNSDDLSTTLRGSLSDNFLDKNLGFRLVLDEK